MSGWDTSSKPSWGPQDDPGDNEQLSPASDFPSQDLPGAGDSPWSSPDSPPSDPGRASRQPGDRPRAGLPGDGTSAAPPPEFFAPDYAKHEYAKRTPGATLSRRELPPGRELPPSRDPNGRDPNGLDPNGRDLSGRGLSPSRDLASRELAGRDLPAVDGSGWDRNGRGKHSAAPRDAPSWQAPARSEPTARDLAPWQDPAARPESARNEAPRSGSPWDDVSRNRPPHGSSPWDEPGPSPLPGTMPTRNEPAWTENGRNENGRGASAWPNQGRPAPAAPGQEQGRQELALRNPAGAGYSAQAEPPEPPPMAALSPDALDREHAARVDPALQDFFASGGATRIDTPRRDPAPGAAPGPAAPSNGSPKNGGPKNGGPQNAYGAQPSRGSTLPPGRLGPGLPDPGLSGPGQPRYPGDGYGEQGTRRSGSNGNGVNGSPQDGQARRPRTGPLAVAMTGPMMAVKGAALLVTPKEDEPLLTKVLRFTGVGTVVIVAIIVGVYLATHSGGGSPNATVTQQANPQPNQGGTGTGAGAGAGTKASPSASAKASAKPKTSKSAGKKKKGTGSTASYVLSTPSTAGGYPMGQDPHFLATATSTAQGILSAVSLGGGGTTSGSRVSASYMLPSGSQVVTFVGYHGTFDPAKVIASMGSYGTTDGTYRDAKAGDSIACANTTSSPSGAVCVWATTTTVGVTEFFDTSGPEALTVSQDKGAADTIKLRASVEAKK